MKRIILPKDTSCVRPTNTGEVVVPLELRAILLSVVDNCDAVFGTRKTARSAVKIVAALEAAKGKACVDLEDTDFELLKQAFGASSWYAGAVRKMEEAGFFAAVDDAFEPTGSEIVTK